MKNAWLIRQITTQIVRNVMCRCGRIAEHWKCDHDHKYAHAYPQDHKWQRNVQKCGLIQKNTNTWRKTVLKDRFMYGNVNQFGFKTKKFTGLLLVYAFLLSSCATTNTYDTQETIEITENYSVSEEVREEFGKAVALMKEGEYEEAIQLLRAVTGKTSKFTSPYINLGIAYIATDQLDKAEQSLIKALKLNKTHPAANNEMALVYRKTGRFTEARKLYQEVLTRYPEFLPARRNLGVLCDLYLQDLKCALEQYEHYLNLQPDDKQVQIWVADVKQRM